MKSKKALRLMFGLGVISVLVFATVMIVQARIKFIQGGNYLNYFIDGPCLNDGSIRFNVPTPTSGQPIPSGVIVDLFDEQIALDEDELGLGTGTLFSKRHIYDNLGGGEFGLRVTSTLNLQWLGGTPIGADIYVDKISTTLDCTNPSSGASPYPYIIVRNKEFEDNYDDYWGYLDVYNHDFDYKYSWSEPILSGTCTSSSLIIGDDAGEEEDKVYIQDLNLAMYADFDWDTPLTEFTLTSPQGTTVSLFETETNLFSYGQYGTRCEYVLPGTPLVGDPLPNLVFDEDSSYSYNYFSLSDRAFDAEDSLDVFNGEFTEGEWTLNACSTGPPGTIIGYFNCWHLAIDGKPVQTVYMPSVIKASSTQAPTFPNGNFESGNTIWTEYSSNGFPLIYPQNSLPVSTHNGNWAAWLGGLDDELSKLSQNVTVPAQSPILSYWHWIGSVDVCGYDFARVYVNGTLVSQLDMCNTTGGWVNRTINLSSYAGTQVNLRFEVETDFSNVSNQFLDDVTWQSTQTAPTLLEPGVNNPADNDLATKDNQETQAISLPKKID